MIAFSSPQAVAIYAGFSSGAILGACIISRTELLRRGAILQRVDSFERVPLEKAIKAVLAVSLRLLLVAAVMWLVGLGIMRVGGLQNFNDITNLPFGLALLTGAALAKFVGYLYWRFRNQG